MNDKKWYNKYIVNLLELSKHQDQRIKRVAISLIKLLKIDDTCSCGSSEQDILHSKKDCKNPL